MIDKEAVKRFVRETLGCTCPQEVFQHIDYKSDVSLGDNILLDYEINVGHRLLIFVTEMNEPDLVIKTGA